MGDQVLVEVAGEVEVMMMRTTLPLSFPAALCRLVHVTVSCDLLVDWRVSIWSLSLR